MPGAPEPSASPVRSTWWPDPVETAAVLAVIAVAVAVLEYYYSFFPVPPGVDPGDWIQRSYGWVGLAHPPADAVGSPYLYPPLMFPILGGLRLLTGSPLATGFAYGGLALALYGLSVWVLARAALARPEYRVAAVALGILNGTVFSMLFWGGYPNFLAFGFFDLALAGLIGFLRRPSNGPALLLGVGVALTYLTHTLTFDLLVGTIVLAVLGSIVLGRLPWRALLARGPLVAAALVVVTVAGYSVALSVLHIPRIDYLYSNPPAFTLSGLGNVFVPLAKAPTIWGRGDPLDLSARAAAAILGLSGIAILGGSAIAARRWPARWGAAALVASAWSGVMLLAPVGGYLARVETDYSRFVYFLPLPLVFLALTALEAALPAPLVRREPTPARGDPPSSSRLLRPRPFSILSTGVVVLVVFAMVVNVTIPTAALAEHGSAGVSHDSEFLAATSYLASNPAPGSVLTVEGTARWVEALTDRGAFDPGPTWLLYEPWQIVNAEEAYFALSSTTVVTNNALAVSYSGAATASLSQAPLISAFVLGVAVPLVRVLPASERVGTAGANCTGWSGASSSGPPALTVPGPTPISGEITELGACATTVQTTTLDPSAGVAWLNYTVTPLPGDAVNAFNVTLASSQSRVGAFHPDAVVGITASGTRLAWSVSTQLGEETTNSTVALNGTVSPAPSSAVANASNGTGEVAYSFANPTPSAPLHVSLDLSVAGASNPAVVLPTVLPATEFFSSHGIEFALIPGKALYPQTVDFLSATFGFVTVFQDPEWIVLQAP